MLLVANLANTKWYKKSFKMTKKTGTCTGISLIVISKSYPMNTNMTGFQNSLRSYALEVALALEGLKSS